MQNVSMHGTSTKQFPFLKARGQKEVQSATQTFDAKAKNNCNIVKCAELKVKVQIKFTVLFYKEQSQNDFD